MYTFCRQKLLYVSFLKFVFQKFMSQIISAFSGNFFFLLLIISATVTADTVRDSTLRLLTEFHKTSPILTEVIHATSNRKHIYSSSEKCRATTVVSHISSYNDKCFQTAYHTVSCS